MQKQKPDLLKIIREIQNSLQLVSGDLQQNRQAFEAYGASAKLPEPCQITPVSLNSTLTAEWINANETTSDAVLLYLHGGGFSVGSAVSHRLLIAHISKAAKTRVLALNYRLTPENRFPAALEDAVTAYKWLMSEGFPATKIAIAGDSAGGGLTMASLLEIRNRKLPQPAAAIGISPWLDLLCSSESHSYNRKYDPTADRDGLTFVAKAYAKPSEMTNPLISPFYASDLSGLCPLLLQIGTHETLLDENRTFTQNAQNSGVSATLQEWPEMVHVWHSLVGLIDDADDAVNHIGMWLQEIWKKT